MAGDYDYCAAVARWQPIIPIHEYGEEPCPELALRTVDGIDYCKLNDKLCVREGGDTCPYYEEYLQELKEEKEDELKDTKETEQEKEELFNEVKNES